MPAKPRDEPLSVWDRLDHEVALLRAAIEESERRREERARRRGEYAPTPRLTVVKGGRDA